MAWEDETEPLPEGHMTFVEIERIATGERRFVDDKYAQGCDYNWTDGNFGCDCNLSAMFGDPDDSCGGPDRFRVIRVWSGLLPAERSPLCDDTTWTVRKAWP